jgi:hypothetical protein
VDPRAVLDAVKLPIIQPVAQCYTTELSRPLIGLLSDASSTAYGTALIGRVILSHEVKICKKAVSILARKRLE